MRRFLGAIAVMLAVAAVCAAAGAAPAVVPLERAHSHNDYSRPRPLLDALDAGFCSIEADIFLVDGELLVAHDADKTDPARTLRGMYLDPLRERVKQNGGWVYRDGPPVTLFIDIKDDAAATYARLAAVLGEYADMLTSFTKDATETRAVTVIISGNTPRAVMAAEDMRLAAVDGRLPDLAANPSPHLVPMVSMSWGDAFKWNGKDAMPADEAARLKEMVAKAHAQGRRIRFWGLPRPYAVWPVLRDAGVDLLNADNLAALQKLLLEQKEGGAPKK